MLRGECDTYSTTAFRYSCRRTADGRRRGESASSPEWFDTKIHNYEKLISRFCRKITGRRKEQPGESVGVALISVLIWKIESWMNQISFKPENYQFKIILWHFDSMQHAVLFRTWQKNCLWRQKTNITWHKVLVWNWPVVSRLPTPWRFPLHCRSTPPSGWRTKVHFFTCHLIQNRFKHTSVFRDFSSVKCNLIYQHESSETVLQKSEVTTQSNNSKRPLNDIKSWTAPV